MALIDIYSNSLNAKQVAHLLRRATFGPNQLQIKEYTGKSVKEIVNQLLIDLPTPNPPIDEKGKSFNELAWGFPGTTDAERNTLDGNRRSYLKRWWHGQALSQGVSITQKLTLFWQNHFVTSVAEVSDARYIYRYAALLRKNALGNFRSLVIEITKDPAMLEYLNGTQNTKGSANENYARELQELFTIGVGNYDENDVKAAARVLTGWHRSNYRNITLQDIFTDFRPNIHDTGDKVFSNFYQNKIIKGRSGDAAGDEELKELVDMILSQKETARFMVRKLYRWFVQAEISPAIEKDFIEPLAAIFRKDYEIKPVLKALFESSHFYDENLIGAQIASPLELVIGSYRFFDQKLPDSKTDWASYDALTAFIQLKGREQQQNVFEQPSVFGWRPYYDTDFYELWINSTTLALRGQFTDALVKGSTNMKIDIDTLGLAKKTSEPTDPMKMLEGITENIFALPLTKAQKDYLVDAVLLQGIPRYEWYDIWNNYDKDPGNANKKAEVKKRLDALITYMLRLAEYQMV